MKKKAKKPTNKVLKKNKKHWSHVNKTTNSTAKVKIKYGN